MKTGKLLRPNPLLSFTISPEEYKYLENIANERGVTIAQVGRGYFRLGTNNFPNELIPKENPCLCFPIETIVRLGAF